MIISSRPIAVSEYEIVRRYKKGDEYRVCIIKKLEEYVIGLLETYKLQVRGSSCYFRCMLKSFNTATQGQPY